MRSRFDVHIAMGTQLEDSGLVDLAAAHFRKAGELRPDDVALRVREALLGSGPRRLRLTRPCATSRVPPLSSAIPSWSPSCMTMRATCSSHGAPWRTGLSSWPPRQKRETSRCPSWTRSPCPAHSTSCTRWGAAHVVKYEIQISHHARHFRGDDGLPLVLGHAINMLWTAFNVYQGFDDSDVMSAIHKAYARLYPRLLGSPPGFSPTAAGHKGGRALNEYWLRLGAPSVRLTFGGGMLVMGWEGGKIRVGFVSAYFRRHSVCKLFCGVIRGLPRDVFDVVIFSSTHRKDDLTEVRMLTT
jgi:hypothetical protein